MTACASGPSRDNFVAMGKFKFVFAVCALGFASYAAAFSDAKKIAEEQCRMFEKALLAKDVDYFHRVAAPGFTSTESGRTSDLEQSMTGIKQMFAMVTKITSAHSTVKSASLSGNKLTALVDNTMTALMKSPKGKMVTLADHSTDREVWIKTSGGWKVKSVNTLTDKMTVNGKPFGPGA